MFSNWSVVPNLANINFTTNYSFSSSDDGTKVFALNVLNGNVYYSCYYGTTYTNWLPVPNAAGVVFTGDPEIALVKLNVSADGTVLCLQSGTGNTNIYYAIYNGTTYSSWVAVPNQAAIVISPTPQGAGNGFCTQLSADGTKLIVRSATAGPIATVYYSFRNGNTFTNWSPIPNDSAFDLIEYREASRDNTKIVQTTQTTNGDGEYDINFCYSLYTGTTYTSWQLIPNPTSVLFTSQTDQYFSSGGGLTKVFTTDETNTVYYSLFSNGAYSPWLAVPNTAMFTFEPLDGILCSEDGTKLYATGTDNNYYYSLYNGTTYSSWALLPNVSGIPLLDSGLVTAVNDKLFLLTADNRIYYALYSNGMYSSWQLVPNAANVVLTGLQFNADGTLLFAQASEPTFNLYYATFNGTGYTNWTMIPNATGLVFSLYTFYNYADGTKVFNQSVDSVGNYYFSLLTTPTPTPTPTPIISDICFPAGTPVNTDQGVIAINNIEPLRHTINGKRILHITQTVSVDKYLICIEKGALGPNTPTSRTVMTKQHKILYQGVLVPAERLLDFPTGVKKVKYDGQLLYNILLEQYGVVRINNLTCETLHPDNAIAKLYQHQIKCEPIRTKPNKFYTLFHTF